MVGNSAVTMTALASIHRSISGNGRRADVKVPLTSDDGSHRGFPVTSRRGTCQVRLLRDPAKVHASFDDPNLMSRAGLIR